MFLLHWNAPAIASADANGYWAQGTRMAESGTTTFTAESPAQYINLHWLLMEDGRYVSRYGPGLSTLVATVYKLAGPDATTLINPLLAVLALLGVYLLAHRFVEWPLAVAAMLIPMTAPSFPQHALACDAHVAAACCLVWGVYLLLRWQETRNGRDAFAAGVVLGLIPTIRYPEGVVGLAVVVFIGLLLWRKRATPKTAGLAVLGAALPITPVLIRSQLLFGGFWRTGYRLTGEQTGFGWEHLKDHAPLYLQHISSDGLGLFFPLGVAGIVMLACRRETRDAGILLCLSVFLPLLVYMAYYWAPTTQPLASLRFLVPIFVVLAVGVVAAIDACARDSRAAAASITVVLLGGQLLWGGGKVVEECRELQYKKTVCALTAEALSEVSEPGDLIVADPGILQNLDFVGGWKLVDMQLFTTDLTPRGESSGDTQEPAPRQAKQEEALYKAYGQFTGGERAAVLTFDILDYAGDGAVLMIGTDLQLDQMEGMMPDWKRTDLKTVELPKDNGDGIASGRQFGRGPTGGFGPPGGFRGRRGGRPAVPTRRRGGGPPNLRFLNGGTEIVISQWELRD
jgi:4-amino-4-deoxy-L-arabinose transferase-like glycosyltransferase